MNLVLFDEASPILWKQKMLYSNEQLSPMSRLLLNNKNFAMSFPWFRLTFIRNSFNPPLCVFPSCEIFSHFFSHFFLPSLIPLASILELSHYSFMLWSRILCDMSYIRAFNLVTVYCMAYVSTFLESALYCLPVFNFCRCASFIWLNFIKIKWPSYLEDLRLSWRIILKWIVEKQNGK